MSQYKLGTYYQVRIFFTGFKKNLWSNLKVYWFGSMKIRAFLINPTFNAFWQYRGKNRLFFYFWEHFWGKNRLFFYFWEKNSKVVGNLFSIVLLVHHTSEKGSVEVNKNLYILNVQFVMFD